MPGINQLALGFGPGWPGRTSLLVPRSELHRTGTASTLRTVAAILANPRYTGRQVWNRQRTDLDLIDRPTPGWAISRCSGGTCPKAGSSPSIPRTRRWSARLTSSPPRTPPCRAARRHGSIFSLGCWPAPGAGDSQAQRSGTAQVTAPAETADLIDRLRASGAVLIYDPQTRTIRASGSDPVVVTAGQNR